MPTQRKVDGNSKGEEGFQKPNFFERKYDTKMEFPEGREGVQFKKPSMGEVWIFSGTAQWKKIKFFCMYLGTPICPPNEYKTWTHV